MKKFEGILFCTDLDGTLYDDNKNVSRKNLEAIEYFKSEGGIFTFITGRVPKTSKSICEIIKPNAPYGCLGGSGIYDPAADEFLWRIFLPEQMIDLVRAVDQQLPEIGIQLNTEKQVYFNKDNPAMVRFRQRTGLDNVYRPFEEVNEPVLKVVFAHLEEAQILALAELLNNHPDADSVDFIRSELTLYEILPRGIDKSTALHKLAELLEIDMNRTIAIGDYYNDLAMVKAAKCGIAVANAAEDVKAVADYVTVSNNDHAIAAIVDLLDRNQLPSLPL